MTKKSLEIHTENILPIIKKSLYSDKDIFVRELVSNSCDAIHKVKLLRDKGNIEVKDEEFAIDVKIDKENKTLTFIDNGIGMDADEVEKYIAQIAFSGAEDFVEKYKSEKEGDQFIGHFGLGFYSAYMASSKVEVNTLSYRKDAKPVLWSCDGSAEYEITEGTRETRGTEITLHIDSDSEDYLEEVHLKEIMNHYCSFLPCPVHLNGTLINTQEPLWIKPASECEEKDYLEFYRYLYPMEEDPLFWIHLNVDYPFHLQGILYFPKMRRDMDINKKSVKLFCNRVFVSDDCKDVIPNYLMALRGVIDSPDIPLNVSRSYLQVDRTVRQLGTHISKKVSDNLSSLFRSDHDRYVSVWNDISTVIKLGSLEDDKFYERVKNIVIWKNVEGKWTTVEDYLERNKEKTDNKIFYTRDEKHLPEFIEMYSKKGIEVLCSTNPIDSYLMQSIEAKLSPATFERIDASIGDHLVDKEREKTILDADGKTEAGRMADFIRTSLEQENLEVETKSLMHDNLPAFVVMDENQRRMRDYMLAMNPEENLDALSAMGKKTFVINTNSPLMTSIYALNEKKPDLAKKLVHETYDLALLSQREMTPNAINEFVTRTNQVIEQLTTALVEKG